MGADRMLILFFFWVDRQDDKSIINSYTQSRGTRVGHNVRPNNFGIYAS